MTKAARRRSGLHRAFVATVFVLGLAAIIHALFDLHRSPEPYLWVALALLAIASDSLRAFKIPGLTAHVSPSEIFLFVIVLLFGSAPGVVTLAVGGLTFSLRRERLRRHASQVSRFQYQYAAFDLAEPALSISVAANVYYWLGGLQPLWKQTASIAEIAGPALAMTAAYFLMNTGLSAVAEAGATGTSPVALWRKYFKDVSVNYVSNAAVAVVLAANLPTREVVAGLGTLADAVQVVVQSLPSLATAGDLTILWLFNPLTLATVLASDAVTRVLLVCAGVLGIVIPLVIAPYRNLALSTGRLEDQKKHVDEIEENNLRLAETLATMAEETDEATSLGHIRSVRKYSLWLAEELGVTDARALDDLSFAALLHDLGKSRVPQYIREKPTRLTEAEQRRMQTHSAIGAEMAGRIGQRFRSGVAPIIHRHHESWDGSGYPDGVAGEAIPLGARILQVADCYDALRRWRPYRRAWTHDEALAIVRERAGTMYDPVVVRAFEAIEDKVAAEPYENGPAAEAPEGATAANAVAPEAELRPSSMPFALREAARSTLTLLLQHLSHLGSQAGVETTGDIVSEYLRRLTPATLVVFYVRDAVANDLVAVHASGYGADLVSGLRMPLGKNVSGWVAINGQSIITDPVLDAVAPLGDVDPRFKSLLSVPLAADDAVIGVVTLYASGENAFQEEQRQALELVSGAIAEAVARAVEYDRARLALFPADELAGVASRLALDELLARDRRKAPVSGRTRAVLYLRNDGEPAVMLHAKMAVSHSTRIADLSFEEGKDALVVILKDADPAAEALILERIAAVLPQDIVAPPSDASPLSLGFACGPRDGNTLDDLLSVARSRAWRAPSAPAPVAATPDQRGLPWKV